MNEVDRMQLEDKDIFIVVGASRTGKGTLLAALRGVNMKYFQRRKVENTAIGKEATQNCFMAPVDKDGNPLYDKIINHSHNSHTLKPKFVTNPPEYADDYCGLDGIYSVDYPGMFESKGPELDAALYLSLQRILLTAKSAKVLILVSAQYFLPDAAKMITAVLTKLKLMFKEPEKHLIIGITKTKMVEMTLGDEEEVLAKAQGEGNETVSFKGYKCIIVEQDETESLQEVVK